jgi:hypothetical protein
VTTAGVHGQHVYGCNLVQSCHVATRPRDYDTRGSFAGVLKSIQPGRCAVPQKRTESALWTLPASLWPVLLRLSSTDKHGYALPPDQQPVGILDI